MAENIMEFRKDNANDKDVRAPIRNLDENVGEELPSNIRKFEKRAKDTRQAALDQSVRIFGPIRKS